MKKTKKLVALGLVAAMVMSSSVATFAAQATEAPVNGEASGDGSLEGYVDKNVFTVDVPADQTIDFKLDPQELLLATNSTAKIDGKAMTKGYGANVLFTDGSDFTTESKGYTVVNLSTMPVSVEATAKLTNLTGGTGDDAYDVKVVEDVADATTTAISMKLTPSTGTQKGTTFTTGPAATAISLTDAASGVAITNTVPAIDNLDAAYEVTGTTGSYQYKLKTDVNAVTFEAITFNLSGEVKTDADWASFNKSSTPLKVEVVYTIDKVEGQTAYALDDLGEIWFALTPFGSDKTAPTPGFEGATISDVTNLKVNGKDATGRIVDGYLVLGYDQADAAVWNVTFTFKGINYSATVS